MIRMGKLSDLNEIEELYENEINSKEGYFSHPNWDINIYPSRLTAKNAIEKGELYVFEVNDNIAGSVILNKNQDEEYKTGKWSEDVDFDKVIVVHTLIIKPEYRGIGIGKKFLLLSEDLGKKLNCNWVRLDTYEDNIKGQSLYNKFGFNFCGYVDLKLKNTNGKLFKIYDKKIG